MVTFQATLPIRERFIFLRFLKPKTTYKKGKQTLFQATNAILFLSSMLVQRKSLWIWINLSNTFPRILKTYI